MNRSSRFSLLALLLAALLTVSACSSGAGGSAGGPTRTVTDIEGTEVQVPVEPARIVTLSEPTLDAVLALGLTPVGTVSGRGLQTVPGYLGAAAQEIPLLGTVAQPNFEAIGSVSPDLILVDGTSINNNPPVIEALRQIAPVVYTGYAGGDWRSNLQLVAESVNMAEEGEALIADYDTRAAAAAGQLQGYQDQTFSVVRWQGNSAALILKELPAGRALTDVGLQRPANQDRIGRGHSEPVSAENLHEIDADHIFFGTLGGSSVGNPLAGGGADVSEAQAAIDQAAGVPGFTQLSAYQQGNIIPVDGSAWTSTGGPLLMSRLIDDILTALTEGNSQ